MQIVSTCDRAHHLLPLAVCVAAAERKEVVRPFLAARKFYSDFNTVCLLCLSCCLLLV